MKYYKLLVSLLVVLPLLIACNEDDDTPTGTDYDSDYRPVRAVSFSPDSSESMEVLYSYEGDLVKEIAFVSFSSDQGYDTTAITVSYNSDNKATSLSVNTEPYKEFDYDNEGRVVKVWDSNEPEDDLTFVYSGNLLTEVTHKGEDYIDDEYIPITDKYTYEDGKVVEVASQLDETVMANIDAIDWGLNLYTYSYTGNLVTELMVYDYNYNTKALDTLDDTMTITYDTEDRVVLVSGTDGEAISFVYNENYMTGATHLQDSDSMAFSYEWEKGESNVYEIASLFMSDSHFVSFISDDLNLFMSTILFLIMSS